ncbi:MAG: hypothetical protein ACXU9U_03470 [Parachlamydiaceae bacterium]
MEPLANAIPIEVSGVAVINPFEEIVGNRAKIVNCAFSEEIKIDLTPLFWKAVPYAAVGAGIGGVVTGFALWLVGQPITGTYIAIGSAGGGAFGAVCGCSKDLIEFYEKCKTNYKLKLIRAPFCNHIEGLSSEEWQSCIQTANSVYMMWIKQKYPKAKRLQELLCPIDQYGLLTFPVKTAESGIIYEFQTLMDTFKHHGYNIEKGEKVYKKTPDGQKIPNEKYSFVACPLTRKQISKAGLTIETDKMIKITRVMARYLKDLRIHIIKSGFVWDSFLKTGIKTKLPNINSQVIFRKITGANATTLTLDEATIVAVGAETYRQAILQRNTQVYAAGSQTLANSLDKGITPEQEQEMKQHLVNWYNEQKELLK